MYHALHNSERPLFAYALLSYAKFRFPLEYHPGILVVYRTLDKNDMTWEHTSGKLNTLLHAEIMWIYFYLHIF